MSRKTVTLSRQYETHGKVFDSVTLREPTFADYFALGEPREAQPAKGGGMMILTYTDIIRGYIDRCAVEPTSECLQGLGLKDAKALQEAVLGFFREPPASAGEGATSSSVPDGAPATSTH